MTGGPRFSREKDRAADGPGNYPTMKNYVVFDKSSYVDDVLTDHQEAIICGIYRLLPCELYVINIITFQYLDSHQLDSPILTLIHRLCLGGRQRLPGGIAV
jgi:hypothetical protein